MDLDIWTLNMSLARRFCPLSAQESTRAEKYRTHLHRYLRPSYMSSPTSTTPYIYSNSHKLCEQLMYRGRRRYGLRHAPPLSAPRARVVAGVILEATREARSSRVILRARYAREALAAGCGPVWRSQIRDAQAGEAISSLCFTDHCQTLMTGTGSLPGRYLPKITEN